MSMSPAGPQVWPPLLTPFLPTGEIDFGALAHLVEFYIEMKVEGFLVLGLSGELFELDSVERRIIVERVATQINGRARFVVGTTGSNPGELKDQAIHHADLGADATVLLASQIVEPEATDDDLAHALESLLEAVPGPLGIYEAPLPYKRVLGGASFSLVSESGRFTFMKDACQDLELMGQRATISASSPVTLLNAEIFSLRSSMTVGYHGFCGLVANLYPHLVARAADATDKEGEELGLLLSVADAALEKGYPSSAKHVLSHTIGYNFSSYSRRLRAEAEPRSITSLTSFDRYVARRFKQERPAQRGA
ncbi:4-hydroxy-tetrahydrodipicolinate synthase [Ruaniaceae bacterium KH17]|nr:4-hydroxy-tetrahydrodipicolinate synthase [Ruaniaceae bacterium KH17]